MMKIPHYLARQCLPLQFMECTHFRIISFFKILQPFVPETKKLMREKILQLFDEIQYSSWIFNSVPSFAICGCKHNTLQKLSTSSQLQTLPPGSCHREKNLAHWYQLWRRTGRFRISMILFLASKNPSSWWWAYLLLGFLWPSWCHLLTTMCDRGWWWRWRGWWGWYRKW